MRMILAIYATALTWAVITAGVWSQVLDQIYVALFGAH